MKLPGGRLTPQRLLRVGVALWLLSLLTPDARGHTVGAAWLAYAPAYGARLLVRGLGPEGSWRNVLTGEESSAPDEEIRVCVSAPVGDCVVDL